MQGMPDYNFPRPPVPTRGRRRPRVLLIVLILLAVVGGCLLTSCVALSFALSFFRSPSTTIIDLAPAPTPTPCRYTVSRHYKVTGKPTLDVTFINEVLASYDSPAVGKGQALYNDGVSSGIDPAYALAFFLEESSMGTRGVATVTHALGNIRAQSGQPEYHGYREYKTWEEGFKDWYRLINEEYIARDLLTVDQIVPIYAPNSDHNNVEQYVHTIKLAVDKWRSGCVMV